MKETIQKHSTNKTKNSKYEYKYYQNTHIITKTPTQYHNTHTIYCIIYYKGLFVTEVF